MKTIQKCFLAVLILLTTFLFNAHATTNVSLTIDHGTNAALHWPSEPTNAFIIGYRTTLSATNPWTLLTDVLAATNGVQTDFTNQGAIGSSSLGFYVVSEFSEDFDGDGVDNGTEILLGTDPFVADNSGDAVYPAAPSVYSGEEVIFYNTNSGTAANLGPFLYANSAVANTMVTTEPTPGELHLKWTSAVVDHSDSFAAIKSFVVSDSTSIIIKPLDDPAPTPSDAEYLRPAFGPGTDIDAGIVSSPNQAIVDTVPIDVLQRYEQIAINQINKNFATIQAINSGTKQGSVKANIASIHTQWTREQAICRSLTSRIGRAAGKVLPLLGGIFIIANSAANAQDFIDTALAYSNDILTGNDETGDAAIFAGVCNNIAPGSSDIVLGYLLR